MRYILASKSPRRKEILQNLGIEFEIICADTDEESDIRSPEELTEELARRKGRAVKEMLAASGELSDDDVIISADTVVAVGTEILGKPTSRKDAYRMLRLLSGKGHKVVSGLCLIRGEREICSHSVSRVYFDRLSDEEIWDYIDSGEPQDKAGAYAVQGLASRWIRRIDGCYFGIVGLPVNLLHKMLKKIEQS